MSDRDARSSRLVIRRTSDTDIKLRSIFVSLDGGPEKAFQFGEAAELSIQPGEHELRVTNRLFSKSVRFTIEPGSTAKFMVANRSGGCLLFFAAASGAVASRISLERIP